MNSSKHTSAAPTRRGSPRRSHPGSQEAFTLAAGKPKQTAKAVSSVVPDHPHYNGVCSRWYVHAADVAGSRAGDGSLGFTFPDLCATTATTRFRIDAPSAAWTTSWIWIWIWIWSTIWVWLLANDCERFEKCKKPLINYGHNAHCKRIVSFCFKVSTQG